MMEDPKRKSADSPAEVADVPIKVADSPSSVASLTKNDLLGKSGGTDEDVAKATVERNKVESARFESGPAWRDANLSPASELLAGFPGNAGTVRPQREPGPEAVVKPSGQAAEGIKLLIQSRAEIDRSVAGSQVSEADPELPVVDGDAPASPVVADVTAPMTPGVVAEVKPAATPGVVAEVKAPATPVVVADAGDGMSPERRKEIRDRWLDSNNRTEEPPPAGFAEEARAAALKRESATWRARLGDEVQGKEYDPRNPDSWRKGYNPETVAVLRETMGGVSLETIFQQHGLTDEPGGAPEFSEQGRNAYHIRQYMRAQTDEQRQSALRGLEDEVLSGNNHYALEVLKMLALTEAARKLKVATTPEEQKQALKELAGLELGEFDSDMKKARDTLLTNFPSGDAQTRAAEAKLSQGERSRREAARQSLAESAVKEAGQEKMGVGMARDLALLKATTGNAEERKEALKELEKLTRESLLGTKSEDGQTVGKGFQKAQVMDALAGLTSSEAPKDAASAAKRIQDLAVGGNREAQDLLQRLDSEKISRAVKDLTASDPEVRAQAVQAIKGSFDAPIREHEEIRRKSAADILAQLADRDPAAVEKAREEAAQFAKENFERADKHLEKYLDRESSQETRHDAIKKLEEEDAARLRALRNDSYNPILHAVRAAESARQLHELTATAIEGFTPPEGQEKDECSITHAASQVKQKLEEMMTSRADPLKGNPDLHRYLDVFKEGELDQIVKDLDDPARQEAALTRLRDTLPKPDAVLDELRVGRIVRRLDSDSSPEDYGKAVDSLRDESEKHGNKTAAEWLKWAEPAKALAEMKHATTPEVVANAVADLAKMAPENPYARRALAAFLISDSGKDSQLDWQRHRNGSVHGKPTFVPDLAQLQQKNPQLFDATKLAAIKALSESTGTPKPSLTIGESSALATAVTVADQRQRKAAGDEVKSDVITAATDLLKRSIAETSIDPMLKKQVPSDGSRDTMRGLRQVLTSDTRSREALVETYLTGAKHPEFGSGFDDFERKAVAGDDPAIAILAASSGGISDIYGLGDRAAKALDIAGSDQLTRSKVTRELLRAVEKYGDTHKLLETLGSMANREEAISPEVRAALKKGVESSNPRTHRSAVAGLMNAAERWTKEDLEIVSSNLTPEMIKGLAINADRIPADLRTELIRRGMEKADPTRKVEGDAAVDFRERVTAIRTVAALGKFVSEAQVIALGQMGDSKGQELKTGPFKEAAGLDGLKAIGIENAKERLALQTEAGKAILQIMGRSDNTDVKSRAYESFAKLRWDGVAKPEVRDAIVAYVQGKGDIPLHLHDEVSRLIYDANIPLPSAAVLRNMRPGLTDAEYYQRAEQVGKHYGTATKSGDSFVREVSARATLWNSLDAWQRRDITGSDSPKSEGQSVELNPKNMDHRIFNALPAHIRENLTGSARHVSASEQLPDLSGKSIDADAFNSLPPDLRRQLTGKNDDIDMAQLEGVMVNGTMSGRYAHLLPEQFAGKSLDQVVKSRADSADAQTVRLASNAEYLAREKERELRSLIELTKEGTSLADSAGHIITLGGLLDESPLDKWEKTQGDKVRSIRDVERRMEANAQALAQHSGEREVLRFSQAIGDYQMNLNQGFRKQADLLSVKMLKDYGPDMMRAYAPQAYQSLTKRDGGEGNLGRSGLQRLADNGMGSIRTFPDFSQDPSKRFNEGLVALTSGWPPGASAYGTDVEAYRRAALKSIDADPAVNAFGDVGRAMHKNMNALSQMFQAGSEGTKYQTLVDDCKVRAKEMSDALSKITPGEVAAARARVQQMKDSLGSMPDEPAKVAVREKIKALEEMLKIADPSSPDRKQLDEMLKTVQSRDFNADTCGNWLKENALVIAVTIAAAAITIASLGAASPLAVIMITSAVCLGVSQATKEGLYLVNHHVGDTGLGKYSERSYAGEWSAKTYEKAKTFFSTMDGRTDGQNEEEFAKLLGEAARTLATDVALPLATEYAMNVVMGLACFGLGQLGAQGLKGLSPGNLRSVLLSKPGAQMAAQMEQAAAVTAKSPAGKQFFSAWMKRFAGETRENIRDTVIEESAGKVTDAALQKYVGQGNSWVALGISGSMALIQGRRGASHMRVGEGKSLHVTPEFAPELVAQYKADGHTVKEIAPGKYEVTAYNAVPGDTPATVFVTARGEGQPPRDLTPDGKPMVKRDVGPLPDSVDIDGQIWSASPDGRRAMDDVGRMTDDFVAGNYDKVVATATASNKPVTVTEVPTKFDLDAFNAPGADKNAAMDAYLSKMGKTGLASGSGDAMSIPRPTMNQKGIEVDLVSGKATANNTGKDQAAISAAEAEVAAFKQTKEGQRILAERAIIAMEEGVHIRQAQSGAPISPSYAQFTDQVRSGADRKDAMDPVKRSKAQLEQEVILALHDKGWTVDQLKHHFGKHHTDARAEAFKWLDAQQSMRSAPDLQKSFETALKNAPDAAKQQMLADIPAAVATARKILDDPKVPADKKAELLKQVQDSISDGSFIAKSKALDTLIDAAGKRPDMPIDVQVLLGKNVPPGVVREYSDLVKQLEPLAKSGMDPVQVKAFEALISSRLQEVNALAAAGTANPAKFAEHARSLKDVSRVLDVLNVPANLKHVDKGTIESMFSLLDSSKRNANLHVPFENLLAPGVKPSAVKRYAELVGQYADVHRAGSAEEGHVHEHETSNRMMKVLETTKLKTGANGAEETWLYVPAQHNSTADGMGIDGALINAKTGEVIFTDLSRTQVGANDKARKGKMWGVSIDDPTTGPVGGRSDADIARNIETFISGTPAVPAAPGKPFQPAVDGQRVKQSVADGKGGFRTWTTDDFHDVTGGASTSAKPEFPGFGQVQTAAEVAQSPGNRNTVDETNALSRNLAAHPDAAADVSTIRSLQGKEKSKTLTGVEMRQLADARKNPLAVMWEGANKSYNQRRAEMDLATGVHDMVRHAIDIRANNFDGSVVDQNPKFRTDIDNSKIPPRQFVEFTLEGTGINVGKNVVTNVRVYEDGRIAGRERVNGVDQDVELGNIADFMTRFSTGDARRLQAASDVAQQFAVMGPAQQAQLKADMLTAAANPGDPATRQRLYDAYPALRLLGQSLTNTSRVTQAATDGRTGLEYETKGVPASEARTPAFQASMTRYKNMVGGSADLGLAMARMEGANPGSTGAWKDKIKESRQIKTEAEKLVAKEGISYSEAVDRVVVKKAGVPDAQVNEVATLWAQTRRQAPSVTADQIHSMRKAGIPDADIPVAARVLEGVRAANPKADAAFAKDVSEPFVAGKKKADEMGLDRDTTQNALNEFVEHLQKTNPAALKNSNDFLAELNKYAEPKATGRNGDFWMEIWAAASK